MPWTFEANVCRVGLGDLQRAVHVAESSSLVVLVVIGEEQLRGNELQ